MLFEDGHATLWKYRVRPGTENDDLFMNDDGFVQAGLHADDAVLAPSSTPPLVFVSGN